MKKQYRLTLGVLTFALVLSGCVAVPHLETNNMNTVPDINHISEYALTNHTGLTVLETEKWWEEFNDSQLNTLVEKVVKNNEDMKIAQLNIEKSEQNIKLARSNYLPEVDVQGSIEREKLSEQGLYPPPYGGMVINYSQLNLTSSYTFDFFGKFDAMVKEAQSQKEGLKLKQDYLVLNLSNQTVKLYAYWQYLKAQQTLLNEQVALDQSALSLEQKRVQLGNGLPENVLNAQNRIKNTEINIETNNKDLKLTEDNLQNLAGSFKPEDMQPDTRILTQLHAPVESVSANVVKNRPDIAYYLTTIQAQESKLKELKADFYPQISISGDLGFQKIGIGQLLKKNSEFWDFGPSITFPIFDSGRIKSNYKVAGVDMNIYVEQYNQAVMKAFYDVNDELYKSKSAWAILNKQNETFLNQKDVLELNRKKYQIGTLSLLDWNKTQSSFMESNTQNLNNQYQYFSTQIDLIMALGGVAKQ